MFPGTYFPPTYFPATYWPVGGSLLTPTGVPAAAGVVRIPSTTVPLTFFAGACGTVEVTNIDEHDVAVLIRVPGLHDVGEEFQLNQGESQEFSASGKGVYRVDALAVTGPVDISWGVVEQKERYPA